jgi:hypothetical protein
VAVPAAQNPKDVQMPRTNLGLQARLLHIAVAAAVVATAAHASASADDPKEKKVKGPSLSLKSNPPVAFSPARITVTAELRGGDDEDGELYCPALEWEWGDGTTSEAREDCGPFEAGKSVIKRRFVSTHTFTTAGNYRVLLRLKRGSKSIVGGSTNVQVKPGVRDMSDFPQP